MSSHVRLSDGLTRIRNQFLDRLIDRRDVILKNILDASEESDRALCAESLIAARQVLHQIAGTAGTLGYGKLGHDARHLEDLLTNCLTDGLSDDGLDLVVAFAADCDAILAQSDRCDRTRAQ